MTGRNWAVNASNSSCFQAVVMLIYLSCLTYQRPLKNYGSILSSLGKFNEDMFQKFNIIPVNRHNWFFCVANSSFMKRCSSKIVVTLAPIHGNNWPGLHVQTNKLVHGLQESCVTSIRHQAPLCQTHRFVQHQNPTRDLDFRHWTEKLLQLKLVCWKIPIVGQYCTFNVPPPAK